MICIYHSRDLDGHTSGAIVKRWHEQFNTDPKDVLKLIGYDYGQPVPYDQIPAGEAVVMIDVSLKMPEMAKLAIHSGHQFTWIDHHASAIKDFREYQDIDLQSINAVLEDGISACEGAWKYFFQNRTMMPTAIQLLGEYDTWRNADKERWENMILPFQFGMRTICSSPETFPVKLFDFGTSISAEINSIIERGKTVLQYQAEVNTFQCKKASFEAKFAGLRAICLNGGGFNSDVFKSVYDPEKHDLMMPFQFDGKQWTVSLYTTKPEVDCSEIAKSMGGGGHKKASGFQVKDITMVFPLIKSLYAPALLDGKYAGQGSISNDDILTIATDFVKDNAHVPQDRILLFEYGMRHFRDKYFEPLMNQRDIFNRNVCNNTSDRADNVVIKSNEEYYAWRKREEALTAEIKLLKAQVVGLGGTTK